MVYKEWSCGRLTQVAAAKLLTVSVRTFRRYVNRYRVSGPKGLEDKRRRASTSEIDALKSLYETIYSGWSVRAFFEEYRRAHGGTRSYTWVKDHLQAAGLVQKRFPGKASSQPWARMPAEGMLIHVRRWSFEWLPGRITDLVASIDDASDRVYSGFMVDGYGVWPRFRSVGDVLLAKGLFDAVYTDDLRQCGQSSDGLQFRRAMEELGVEIVPTLPVAAHARANRIGSCLRECLPYHLRRAGVSTAYQANTFLTRYWRKFNSFYAMGSDDQCRFEALTDTWKERLVDILCLKTTVRIGMDGCFRYRGVKFQACPRWQEDCHPNDVVCVHEYGDGTLSVFGDGELLARIISTNGTAMDSGRVGQDGSND